MGSGGELPVGLCESSLSHWNTLPKSVTPKDKLIEWKWNSPWKSSLGHLLAV